MLKLRYLLTDAAAPLAADADTLGVITYSTAAATPANMRVPLHCLDANLVQESWYFPSKLQTGSESAMHFHYCDELLFGSIALDEKQFLADSEQTTLQRATRTAYQKIFALLDRLHFPQLWRVWNFIPQINAIEHGLERYRQFNIDRQIAFETCGRAIAGNVPAASAVGTPHGDLCIYFIAGRSAPIAIENPRQTAAYHYPSAYGPRSPIFSRANLIDCAGTDVLFISGTASIVGHRTLHIDDVAAQTRELLTNIDSLIESANTIAQRRSFARGDLSYKVYVRHPVDYLTIKNEIERWFGATPRVIYLQADICRNDLLVEVEASAGIITEIVSA